MRYALLSTGAGAYAHAQHTGKLLWVMQHFVRVEELPFGKAYRFQRAKRCVLAPFPRTAVRLQQLSIVAVKLIPSSVLRTHLPPGLLLHNLPVLDGPHIAFNTNIK